MYKFFNDCKNLEDVKENYRKLAFANHPDHGGDIEIMKAINGEYEQAFNKFKNVHRTAAGETYESKTENTETAAEFMDIINKLIFMQDVKIELIGRWIWISGNTKPYKDVLNELHFTWCHKKIAWAWHKEEDFKRSHKVFDMDQIRVMFGTEEIKTEKIRTLA